MQKNSQLNLKSYLDIAQLLKHYNPTHQENRTFALTKKLQGLNLLILWKEKNLYRLTDELDSSKYLHYLSFFTSILGFLLLLLGFFTGVALLAYSGKEPVNVLYLLLVMVGLPLLSMLFSLLSLLTGNVGATLFTHLSPLYYLEKMINFLPFAQKIDFSSLSFSSTLSKWIFLQRLQLFSFLFALGLFGALVLTIISKDIAFAWSSTLSINPISFQHILATLATPWQYIFPSAVPSLELIEMSHYFRLGDKLDVNMIANADKLGTWWQFLAMATLTYALLLRLLFWLMMTIGFQRQLEKELYSLLGVKKLLHEFNTPFVSTESPKEEQHLPIKEEVIVALSKRDALEYDFLLAWNYAENTLLLLQDSRTVKAKKWHIVGGKNSFLEEQTIVDGLTGRVLLYVKAWEPPTMDFMDFLEDVLANKAVSKVDISPLGTEDDEYKARASDIAIWLKKLELIDSEKLEVVDE